MASFLWQRHAARDGDMNWALAPHTFAANVAEQCTACATECGNHGLIKYLITVRILFAFEIVIIYFQFSLFIF